MTNRVLQAPLTVGDGVDIGACRMSQATGLERLHVVASDPGWRIFRRRRVTADELESVRPTASADLPPTPRDTSGEGIREMDVNAKTVEGIYRQLRSALEAAKAYPDAADFYYGEMEMRRLAARRLSVERAVLAAYKLVAGYGVRASRALATYLLAVVLVALGFRYGTDWFVADPAKVAGSTGLRFGAFWDCVAIAAKNSVTFFGGISEGLTAAGTALMFLLRLVGPASFALIILALRSRVYR